MLWILNTSQRNVQGLRGPVPEPSFEDPHSLRALISKPLIVCTRPVQHKRSRISEVNLLLYVTVEVQMLGGILGTVLVA
jgi:hypothetical protein